MLPSIIDFVKMVDDCFRMDLFGEAEELKLVLFRLLCEMSTATGFIITLGFDRSFVGLLSPAVNSFELWTSSVALLPGAFTFYLIVFNKFLSPCYFLIF